MTSAVKAIGISFATVIAVTLFFSVSALAHAQSGTGQLNVVVVNSGTSYGTPQITVNGSNVGLGSNTGTTNSYTYSPNWNATTQFTMNTGSYSVTFAQMSGAQYTYGTDCFGTMNAGNQRTCVINVNFGSYNSGYGLLTVNVNVNSSYGYVNPSNITVNISGNNPNPSSFNATSGSRTVTLQPGSYSVTATNYSSGFTQSLSGDCSGYINNGENRSCTINLTYNAYNNYNNCVGGFYNGYCNNYYNNYPTQLSCSPSTQTAYVGQTVSFVASGGAGVYNWVVNGRTYPNVGTGFSYIVTSGGTPQLVTVTSGNQTANCYISVIAGGYAGGTSYTGGGIVKGVTYAPGLPYTGEGGEATKTFGTLFGFLVVLPAGLYLAYRFSRRAVSSILS